MFRKKREIELSDGRIACVQYDLSREINKQKYDINITVRDFSRGTSEKVYFNGKKAFIDGDPINAKTISRAIEKNLHSTSPLIVDYIKNYSHQDGFLNLSESRAQAISTSNKKGLLVNNSRYDFISNADGSVTFTERFYVAEFIDTKKFEIKKPETCGRPVAIVVTRSTIRVNNDKIMHTLDSDKIIMLDQIGEELFNNTDGHIEYKYKDALEDIEEKLNADVSPVQNFLKVIDGLNQECEKFKEQLLGRMESILYEDGFAAVNDNSTQVRGAITEYLSDFAAPVVWRLREFSDKNAEFNLLAQQFKLVSSSQNAIKQDRNDPHKREKDLCAKISNFENILFNEENKNIFNKSEDGLGFKFLKTIADILTLGRFHQKLFRPTDQTLFSRNMHAVAAAKTGGTIETNSYEPAAKKTKY